MLKRGENAGWRQMDFRLYYLHCERGFSFREVAGRVGQNEDALKKRHARNIAPILRQVEQEFDSDSSGRR